MKRKGIVVIETPNSLITIKRITTSSIMYNKIVCNGGMGATYNDLHIMCNDIDEVKKLLEKDDINLTLSSFEHGVSFGVPNKETNMHVGSVKQLKEVLNKFPDDGQLIGNCVDEFGRWYNYPLFISKVPGNNNLVAIQSRPWTDKLHKDEE